MSSGEGKVVCVTGASGYIASWLVKVLLLRGYTVRATVRNLGDPNKTEHLLELDGAKERLQLFEANLLEDGSFDGAVDGCEGVFHTASPVVFTTTNPQAEVIKPAVKGTLNVLTSCSTSAVRRVVITSSIAAVAYNGKPLLSGASIDETWHSDAAFCEQSKLWYPYAKTLAEKAAWTFAQQHGIDLVTMHPAFVIGPPLQPALNNTVEMILHFITEPQKSNTSDPYPFVDVRDVAEAHVKALETPSAAGRYCLSATVVSCPRLLNIINQLYPAAFNLPQLSDDDVPEIRISQKRAESLGVNFIPLEVSLKDTIESLKDKGFLTS